jgi:general secretion pathway protein D
MNRLTYWGLPFTLATFSLAASTTDAYAQSAGKLYNQGRAAETRDDVEGAYNDYAKAYQKKPGEERYKISYERLRLDAAAAHVKHGERLRDQGDNTGALTEFLRALEIDPSNELATQDIRVTHEKIDGEANAPAPETAMAPSQRKALLDLGGSPQLKPTSNEPLTVHATDDTKVLYQTIGKLAGINVLFDPDYHSTRLQIDLANVSVYDALRILGTVSGTFWRPITANTIFVAQNTRGKRTELDEEAVQTFYLTNVSQQNDLNDVQTALRNVITTAKLYGVPSQNAIIMRGTPDELLLASKLINDLDKARPEVVVDIAILEVSRTKTRTLGIQLPNTASINFQQSNAITGTTPTASAAPSPTTPPATGTSQLQLNQLAHLNSTNFAVSIGQAQVNLILSDSSTRILQNPRLRATDGQEATVKIGEKLPVATGSYQAGVATAITSSLVNTQFQYLDIGVNIDMKPTVHYDRDVSMKLKIEVSSMNGTENLGGIDEPIITQRTSDQTIRLREGEATILSGLLQKQKSVSVSGYPGLAELPILKYIFGNNTTTDSDDEIVFLLIPHIVRAAEISPLNLKQVDSGTTNDIQLRHMGADLSDDADSGAPVSAGKQTSIPDLAAPRPQIPAGTNPAQMNGTIPGQVVPAPAGTGASAGPQAAAGAIPQANALAQTGVPATGGGGPVTLQLFTSNPTQSIGNTFQEQVMLSGGSDVYSAWQQVQYDQTRLQLVNVDVGDMLGRDGQAVALVHRDDGEGNVAISTSRPPGTAGITGAGTLCTLTFQAKAAGDASIAITRPVVRDSKQQPMQATGSQGVVHIK